MAKTIEVWRNKPVRAVWCFDFERTDEGSGAKFLAFHHRVAEGDPVAELRSLNCVRCISKDRSCVGREVWQARRLKPKRPTVVIAFMKQCVVTKISGMGQRRARREQARGDDRVIERSRRCRAPVRGHDRATAP